jgi:hypothetical protein
VKDIQLYMAILDQASKFTSTESSTSSPAISFSPLNMKNPNNNQTKYNIALPLSKKLKDGNKPKAIKAGNSESSQLTEKVEYSTKYFFKFLL